MVDNCDNCVYIDGSCINNGKMNARAGYGVFFDHNDERNESGLVKGCLLYTSPSPRDRQKSRMPSSA